MTTLLTPSIGIVIPTMGRRSLIHTLLSFSEDLLPHDRVYVVTDGYFPEVIDLVRFFHAAYQGQWTCHAVLVEDSFWGHPLRNEVLPSISTDYVWSIDDDDIATPGTLDVFRGQQADWCIYRMEFKEGHFASGVVCWREKMLRQGDIGTPMVLARPSSARYGLRYEGDWDYVLGLEKQFGEPAWDERVVAYIRPRENEDA